MVQQHKTINKMAAKNGLEPLPKRLTGARATLTLYRNKMAEILGIEPRLRVSKTPLLPLQHIPIKWWELLELNQLLRIFSAT